MAKRRMMTLNVIDTDAFMDMPHSTQCLYMHLLLRADDDGFIANPKKIVRMVGTNDDDLKLLFVKRFVLAFESGVCVIKHWRIHNLIRADRYTETQWQKEKEMLIIDQKTKKYKLKDEDVMAGNVIPPKIKSIKKVIKCLPFDYEMVELLKKRIEQNNPRYQNKELHVNVEKWANTFRLMREQDGFEQRQIEYLVNFSQDHEFWQKNILSPEKLRKHADKLILEAKQKGNKSQVVSV